MTENYCGLTFHITVTHHIYCMDYHPETNEYRSPQGDNNNEDEPVILTSLI